MMNRHSPAFIAVESFDSLDEAAEKAGDVLSRTAQPLLYDRIDWFKRTAEHIDIGGQPLILNARDGDYQGWLFLVRRRKGEAAGLGSWYTLAWRTVFAPGTTERARLRLIAAMADYAHAELGLGHIQFAPIPGWDGSSDLLTQGFREAGWHVSDHPKTENWVHKVVEPNFAAFLAGRPGALRSTIKRKSAKSELKFEIHRKVTKKIWADYAHVFEQSWKGDEGSLPFLRSMAEDEGKAGALRLGIARLSGRAVATQLWTVEYGEAVIHKLAYDEEAKTLSAGTLLSAHMFAAAIDKDHVTLIDYGTGSDAYKRDWMSECRMLVSVEACHPRTIAGAKRLFRNAIARLAGRGRSN